MYFNLCLSTCHFDFIPFLGKGTFYRFARSCFTFQSLFVNLSRGFKVTPLPKWQSFPYDGETYVYGQSLCQGFYVSGVSDGTHQEIVPLNLMAFSAQWRGEETVQLSKVGSYPLIFKHLCESNLPISKIRSIFASYIGKIFVI